VQGNVRVGILMCIRLLHKFASKCIIVYLEVDEVVRRRTGGFKWLIVLESKEAFECTEKCGLHHYFVRDNVRTHGDKKQ